MSSSSSSTTVEVTADIERVSASLGCGGIDTIVKTRETASSVAIEVVGQAAAPLPAGTACGGALAAAKRVTLHLHEPLGQRRLIDASTGQTHPLLELASTRAPHRIPATFTERHGYWDESTGLIYRWWRSSTDAQINLYAGPRTAVAREVENLHVRGEAVGVRGASATVRRVSFGEGWDTTVEWVDEAGQATELQVLDQSKSPLSVAEILEVARSTY